MTGVDREPGESEIDFAWLEVTGKCQLECGHCYADSGPNGNHGSMQSTDWRRVIGQLAGMGARGVQFIGGEPMLYPHLSELIDSAAQAGLQTEVYSNLVVVPSGVWATMARNRTTLATSYYSPDSQQHQAITGRPTLRQTERNIAKAAGLGIAVRAEIIEVLPGQRIEEARARLAELGAGNRPRVDTVRGVGRGAVLLSGESDELDMSQLCGSCTSGTVMVGPSGDVTRCIFTRQVPLGNVLDGSLQDIVVGPDFRRFTSELDAHFSGRIDALCAPQACNPNCGPMSGCMPQQSCSPHGRASLPPAPVSVQAAVALD